MLSMIMLSGCALQSATQDATPSSPRQGAALQLTRQGIQHLNAGRPDKAIRSFEQAIGLNSNNGQCYYYMAQAWLAKGAPSQARQFNELAHDYLKDDRQWQDRVQRQTLQIDRLSK
jgi:tetratricopeptide (TPR) repeat protein